MTIKQKDIALSITPVILVVTGIYLAFIKEKPIVNGQKVSVGANIFGLVFIAVGIVLFFVSKSFVIN